MCTATLRELSTSNTRCGPCLDGKSCQCSSKHGGIAINGCEYTPCIDDGTPNPPCNGFLTAKAP